MESFPPESPECYGLHTNAEIAFRLDQAKAMFEDIQQLQVRPLPVLHPPLPSWAHLPEAAMALLSCLI